MCLFVGELFEGDSGGSVFVICIVSFIDEILDFFNIVQVDFVGVFEFLCNVEVDGIVEGVCFVWIYEGESEGFNVYCCFVLECMYGVVLVIVVVDVLFYFDMMVRIG